MKSFLIYIVLFFSTSLFSQSFNVSSLVSDVNNEGVIEGVVYDTNLTSELAFANVSIKNTTIEVETDFDGSFSINLKPGNYTLIFSFLGYKTVEVDNVKVTASGVVKCNQVLEALKIEADISSINNSFKG
ncbi:carboxypeptidase-like regulatory domain-containing protein [uncultured Lutibacter sp.]|uniref:carboxypeptidase-like regulatory domain-containing protein n=1 Tax=Lutibacter sp. TaxID=1925666 RepID=UPI0026243092|nr:carboxypeptidase-like regulatory domain-containing protein [uncultured Lutibacter sp.]